MSRRYWLLYEDPTGYTIADTNGDSPPASVEVTPLSTPEGTAEAIWQSFQEQGYRGEPVMLALGSQHCLAASVPHTGRSMARNPRTMTFALEEFLPLAAEDLTCDFVTFERDALGVAVEVASIGPLLSMLEQRGVQIANITAAALLSLQYQIKPHGRRTSLLVVWQDGDAVELFELRKGRPRLWRTLPNSPEALARELQIIRLHAEPTGLSSLVACGLSEPLLETARQVFGKELIEELQPLPSAMLNASATILAGAEVPWIELRRDALGEYDPYRPIRRGLKLLAFAAVCSLLMLSVGAWIFAYRYAAIAEASQQKEEDVFRQVFPGKAVPVGIGTRLASEYKKLTATKAQPQNAPQLESVTPLLYEALVSLPKDIRYRLLEIYLESGQVRLDGEVCRHGDADLLAAGLRGRGFRVVAPRTEQLGDKGIGVTITALLAKDEKQKP